MPTKCPHCGMDSDTDRVCSWCNKSLTPESPAKAAAPAAAPGPAAPPSGPVAPTPRPAAPAPVEQPRSLVPYFIGAGVAIVVVIVGALFLAAKAAAGPPPEPAEWQTMPSMTKLISLQVPGNYAFSSSGSASSYEQVTVRATKLCRVHIDGTGTKGAMSDTAAAAARISGGDSSPNVADHGEGRFHAAQGGLHQKKDPKYQETGEMQAWSFAGMPAAYSEYTTVKQVGLFGVKMKGWRLSCMGGDFGYQVWAEAPAAHWEKFQPTAQKIIESATMGSAQ